MTTAEAKETYISIIKPMNVWIIDKNVAWQDSYANSDWQALVALAPDYADVQETAIESLIAAKWPTDVDALVEELIADLSSEVAYFNRIGQQNKEDLAWATIDDPDRADGTVSTEIRIRLGVETEELR